MSDKNKQPQPGPREEDFVELFGDGIGHNLRHFVADIDEHLLGDSDCPCQPEEVPHEQLREETPTTTGEKKRGQRPRKVTRTVKEKKRGKRS